MARVVLVAGLLCVLGGTARAQGELPAGKFGLVTGLRQNTGSLGNSYGFGWLLGVDAGYQPRHLGSTYDLGAAWEVLWGGFGADDPELVHQTLYLLEMSFGLRFRRTLGDGVPRFIALSGGVTLLRSNAPIPPDMKRMHFGPYAGVGLDQYVGGRYLLGLEARYGLITGGPGSLSLVASLAFGSL